MTARDPLVVFTPSGKRGRFPDGTPLLEAARALGVDLDSVCGGRGICGRCQVVVAEGEFAKHGVALACRPASRRVSAVEERYADNAARWRPAAACRCSAQRAGRRRRRRAAGQPGAPPGGAQGAEARDIELDPVVRLHYVEVREPDMHDPSGDLRRLDEALEREWQLDRAAAATCAMLAAAAGRPARGRVEGDRRRARRRAGHRASGRASATRPTAWRSTSARPPSPRTSATSRPARWSRPPA